MLNLPIPNLLNGVSQQPPPVRFPTQAERQVNAYSSPVEGLTKRPPTEHVAKMVDDDDPGYDVGPLGYKFHLIDRGDGIESYAVLVRKAPSSSCTSCVKIYDLKNDGAAVPVFYAGTAASYLVGVPETAYQDLELVSIADYTFIVNRAKTVAMDSTTSPTNTSEGAIIWVAGAGYGQTYTISLKLGSGSEVTVSYTTSDTSFHNQPVTVDFQTFPDKSSTIDSSYIAANLRVALLANPTILGGYDITRDGFALYIKPKTAGASFTAKVTDGESGNDLRIAKDAVNRFEDLPIRAPHNFVMKVAGLPEEDRDDYYVKFVQTGADTAKPGPGEWEETVAPGILTTINAATMPHGLIRYFDVEGNPFFVFKALDGVPYAVGPNPLAGSDITWGTRRVGDTQTNPLPSFVGQTISDIFIFKNRLGFLSGEYVVLSESGEYFNFFRTTVTALLDSEVIDVGSAYPGITLFHAAVPYLDRLILFADKVQMAIQASDGPLSPKTVTLSVVSNYDFLRAASPAPVNDLIFFPFNRGGFSGVRNMQVSQDDSNILTAVDISAHVPQYIAGQIIYMAASSHDNLLVTLTEDDPTKLYIYKWFDNERSRVQSSWSEWTFEDGEVIGFGWEGSTLWIAFRRPEGIYLEKMYVEPDRRDANSEFVVRLDRRASVIPTLEDGILWAELPYVADQIVFGGGNFAEFSVTDVSYQDEFDKQPVKTDPGGEIFASFEGIESGSQNYTGFSGDINLPSTSSAAYFHARLAFTLEPGGSASFTLPLLGIDPDTGYVNLAGRTNSMKTYIYVRTSGGGRTYKSYSGKILLSGVLAGSVIGGWDMVETAGQFNGQASFSNEGDKPAVIEVIFEKAVDLIPDVLIYDGSDTLLYTLRPGVSDPPLYEEQLGYRVGNSLFYTSPLNRQALLESTPDLLDPLVTYAGDQHDSAVLPPHLALNKRCFFAVQDGGRIALGIYTNDPQTFGNLTFTGPPSRLPFPTLPPDGTPLSDDFYTNYGVSSTSWAVTGAEVAGVPQTSVSWMRPGVIDISGGVIEALDNEFLFGDVPIVPFDSLTFFSFSDTSGTNHFGFYWASLSSKTLNLTALHTGPGSLFTDTSLTSTGGSFTSSDFYSYAYLFSMGNDSTLSMEGTMPNIPIQWLDWDGSGWETLASDYTLAPPFDASFALESVGLVPSFVPPITNRSFTTPLDDGYLFFRNLSAGQQVGISFDSLDGSSGPFRWLSFAKLDKTPLGYGEVGETYLSSVQLPREPGSQVDYLRLRKGPLDISGGIVDAMNRAFSPIMDSEGDEAAIVLFYGYDQDTLEEWIGFALRIVPNDDPRGIINNLRSFAMGALWGNLGSYPLASFRNSEILEPASTLFGFVEGSLQYPYGLPVASTFGYDPTANDWLGTFTRGPFTAIDTSEINGDLRGGFVMMPEMRVEIIADTNSNTEQTQGWGLHNGNWVDIKYYLMSYNNTTSQWEIASKLSGLEPTTPPNASAQYGSSSESGDELEPYLTRKVDRQFEYAYSRTIWGSANYYTSWQRNLHPLAIVTGPDTDVIVYPARWATEGTNTVDDRIGVDSYTAIIASGVSSIPVTMSVWQTFGNKVVPSASAVSFPYGIIFQSGATGAGLGDSGLSAAIYYDALGFPEIEQTATGTRIRLEYPLGGNVFTIDGIRLWVGVPYTMEYEFSTPYLKSGENTLTTGRMQVRNMAVEYDKAGYFEVEVYDRETGITRIYEKDLTLGYTHSRYPDDAGIDTPNLTDGSFKFPVMIRNTNARIILRNSSAVPARFLSAEIEASYDSRARRI